MSAADGKNNKTAERPDQLSLALAKLEHYQRGHINGAVFRDDLNTNILPLLRQAMEERKLFNDPQGSLSQDQHNMAKNVSAAADLLRQTCKGCEHFDLYGEVPTNAQPPGVSDPMPLAVCLQWGRAVRADGSDFCSRWEPKEDA